MGTAATGRHGRPKKSANTGAGAKADRLLGGRKDCAFGGFKLDMLGSNIAVGGRFRY